MPNLPFHFGSNEVGQSLGLLGLRDELGIHDQDARARRETIPGAVLGLEAVGQVGRMLGVKRSEQALLLEPDRIQDLVVPEQVAPRLRRLGYDQVRQADGLGALDVKLGQYPHTSVLAVDFQDRIGKLAVKGRVDDNRVGGPGGRAPAGRHDRDKHEPSRDRSNYRFQHGDPRIYGSRLMIGNLRRLSEEFKSPSPKSFGESGRRVAG